MFANGHARRCACCAGVEARQCAMLHTRVGALVVVGLVLTACGSGDNSGGGGGSSTGGSQNGTGGTNTIVPCNGEPTSTGEATYYTFADGSGACGFDATPNDLMVGAMNAPDYGNSEPCGACAHIVGPQGEITVRVVDLCPECPKGNIDLSPEAFQLIAPIEQGRVPISWQYVPCNVTGPVIFHFKDGDNQWWTAVQMRNHRNAISKFEVEQNGAFVDVARVDYNYFLADTGMGPGPYTFRVTDVHGASITETGIALGDNVDRPGTQQFPECP
jgi:expansin (peptidoglycan-binding protein)